MIQSRIVPTVPDLQRSLRLLIDTDAANEIDDLYAIALALVSPDRFRIEGFVATHFATWAGPDSTEESYQLLLEELRTAGCEDSYPVAKGGHPMQYRGTASPSEGADLIIERARVGSIDDPLWVVGLGAATNLASAILSAPEIMPLVRYVFHARNEFNWPTRTTQFNVVGDVIAVQTLLESDVPLVWFDTGTALTLSMEESETRLASLGSLGRYLHEFRHRSAYFARSDKGFFDLGDIAWLIEPGLCREERIPAPRLERHCSFDQRTTRGEMRRVFNIDREPTWDLFFNRMTHPASPVGQTPEVGSQWSGSDKSHGFTRHQHQK